MSRFQRISVIILGALQLLAAVLIFALPGVQDGLLIILLVLSFTFAVSGVKDVVRYFSTARFMVGGRLILIKGVIMLDFGLFSLSLYDASTFIVSLYMIGIFVFSGVVDVLMVREARRIQSPHWKLRMIRALIKVLLGIACLVFIANPSVLEIFFGVSLVYSAVTRIASAFRKTETAYIR